MKRTKRVALIYLCTSLLVLIFSFLIDDQLSIYLIVPGMFLLVFGIICVISIDDLAFTMSEVESCINMDKVPDGRHMTSIELMVWVTDKKVTTMSLTPEKGSLKNVNEGLISYIMKKRPR